MRPFCASSAIGLPPTLDPRGQLQVTPKCRAEFSVFKSLDILGTHCSLRIQLRLIETPPSASNAVPVVKLDASDAR